MFEVGEYVVYGTKGVCQIEDIAHVDIPGAGKDRLYYVMHQIEDGIGKLYVPIDNDKIVMRKVITKDAAEELIRSMSKIEQMHVEDDKNRESIYKEVIRTCDYYQWISMIKTLYFRRNQRMSQGKKVTALDEKYLKAVENELYSELALTLGMTKTEVLAYMKERIC